MHVCVYACVQGWSPLHFAAWYGQSSVIHELCHLGASPLKVDKVCDFISVGYILS